MRLPESLRELRPHLTFWILEKIAGGAVITAGAALFEYFRSHLGIGAIVGLFVLSVTVLGWFDRARSAGIAQAVSLKQITELRPGQHSIAVISARWGIGGDAYHDVTSLVRQNVKDESVNLPASIGLFGDPYPKARKRLLVRYLVTRTKEWEVTVEEGETVKLPEKEGEEQSTKFLEHAKMRLKALQSPKDKLLADISEAEYKVFLNFEGNFNSLRWCEKIALKKLCEAGSLTMENFEAMLDSQGFADPRKIVGNLAVKSLVDGGGTLWPKEPKWLDILFKGTQLC